MKNCPAEARQEAMEKSTREAIPKAVEALVDCFSATLCLSAQSTIFLHLSGQGARLEKKKT